MRKLVSVLAITALVLSGCAKAKTRTEVIDILRDAGYTKYNDNFYALVDGDTTYKVGYLSGYKGYTSTLYTVFGEGPIISISGSDGILYNYQVNDDVVYYLNYCKITNETTSQEEDTATEIAYRGTGELVVGLDDCGHEEDEATFKATLDEKKAEALAIMESLGVSADDLNNLKLD